MSSTRNCQKKNIHSAYELSTSKTSKCFVCNQIIQKMKLKIHLYNEHQIQDLCQYFLDYINPVADKCLCGCGKAVMWSISQSGFFDYIHGHNRSGKTKENCATLYQLSEKMKEDHKTGIRKNSFTDISKEKQIVMHKKRSTTMKKKVAAGEYISPSANMTPEQRSIAQRKSAKTIIEKYGSPNYGFKNIKKGFYTTKDNRIIHFDSGLKLEYMKILDNHPEIVAWERPIFSIPYTFEGKERDYYPDFLVAFKDGHLELQETKGSETENDFAKYSYAQRWANKNTMNYVVLYRKDVRAIAKDLSL